MFGLLANRPPDDRCHPHPRRTTAQPEEPRPRRANRRDDGGHRPVGFGQVEPGVRHAVCGRAAPLRRDLQRLCAPVSRSHGPPGGRSGRRRAAGDRHRPDQSGAHVALDGRHDDRAERSPEAAVRARRAVVRPADRAAGAARHAGLDPRRSGGARHAGRRSAPGDHVSGRTAGERDAGRSRAVAVGQRLHARAGRARGRAQEGAGRGGRPLARRSAPNACA